MEAAVGAAFRVTAGGQVARIQHSGNARDIGLEGQVLQVEVQFYVFVERFRHTRGHEHAFSGNGSGRLLGDIQTALQLADVVRVFVQFGPVVRREVLLKTVEAL